MLTETASQPLSSATDSVKLCRNMLLAMKISWRLTQAFIYLLRRNENTLRITFLQPFVVLPSTPTSRQIQPTVFNCF